MSKYTKLVAIDLNRSSALVGLTGSVGLLVEVSRASKTLNLAVHWRIESLYELVMQQKEAVVSVVVDGLRVRRHSWKHMRKRGETLKTEPNDDIDDLIEGKRTYDIEDKVSPKAFNDTRDVLKRKGKEVSYESLQCNGFSKPILVKDNDGLGIRMPGRHFSVKDVMKHVGSERQVQVIDAATQASSTWSMEQFELYYNTPKTLRKRIWNVISLEFSGTKLDPLVTSPAVVRELDWAQKAWPLDMLYVDMKNILNEEELTFPKVFKYCLMSVAGCYTDFHIDLGGTSVWYHILRGRKIFWLIPPTEENLQKFIEWSTSGEQEKTFLGDICSSCQRVTLQEGNTFFIPTGWIHAVYTPMDSLVFGGNFLHSLNIGLQLRVVAIEEKLRVPLQNRYPYFHEMQWYVYDHYNIALTGVSFMTIDGQPVQDLCDIVEAKPVLSEHELTGLRNLREWLPNQEADTYPDDMHSRQKLLDSMMVAIAKHKNDFSKTHSPRKRSMLQWKQTVLDKHKARWYTSLIDRPTPPNAHSPSSDSNQSEECRGEVPSEENNEEEKDAPKAAAKQTKPVASKHGKEPDVPPKRGILRRARCGQCKGCRVSINCGRCTFCKDMKKFGGRGIMKQCCARRKCVMHTSERFKLLADKDPSQRKLTSILLSPTAKKEKELKARTGSDSTEKARIKVKQEPQSPVKDVVTSPVGSPNSTNDSTSPTPSSSQKTLTQLYTPTASPSAGDKRVEKRKRKSSFSLDDLSEGQHQTAAEFGHSEAHLQNLLDSADTSKLTINGGEVVIYRTDEGQIRVFVKSTAGDKQDELSVSNTLQTQSEVSAKRRKCEQAASQRNDNTEEIDLGESSGLANSEASDSEGEQDALPGGKLVAKLTTYLKSAAGEVRQGIAVSSKPVFLCKAQTVDNDGEMMFIGYPMAVNSDTYFYQNATKPQCKYVKVYDDEISVSLPLVFPKPKHLKKCMDFTQAAVVARECSPNVAKEANSTGKVQIKVDCSVNLDRPKMSIVKSNHHSNENRPTSLIRCKSLLSPTPDTKNKAVQPQGSSMEKVAKPIRVVRIVHPDAASLAASSPISHADMVSMVRSGRVEANGKGKTSSVSMVNVFIPENPSGNSKNDTPKSDVIKSPTNSSFNDSDSLAKSSETSIQEDANVDAVEQSTSNLSIQKSHEADGGRDRNMHCKTVTMPSSHSTKLLMPATTSQAPQNLTHLHESKVFNRSIICPKVTKSSAVHYAIPSAVVSVEPSSTNSSQASSSKTITAKSITSALSTITSESVVTASSSVAVSSDRTKSAATIKPATRKTDVCSDIPISIVGVSLAGISAAESAQAQSGEVKSAVTKLIVKSLTAENQEEKNDNLSDVVDKSGEKLLPEILFNPNANNAQAPSEMGVLVNDEDVSVHILKTDSQDDDGIVAEEFPDEDSLENEEMEHYLNEFVSGSEQMSDIDHDSDDMYMDSSDDNSSLDYMDFVTRKNHKLFSSKENISLSTMHQSPSDREGSSKTVATVAASKKVGKRARACGECSACNAEDCRECVFCLDMKKYGGRGKMKQKCKEKQCLFMSRSKPREEILSDKKTPKTKPVTISVSPKFTRVPAKAASGMSNAPSGMSNAPQSKSASPGAESVSNPTAKFVEIPKHISKETSKSYSDLIREQTSEIRKLPNCGECSNCLDKKEFGGPGKKKQMCAEKKSQLQLRVARLTAEDESEDDGSPGRPLHGRTSSRKRKLTQKMEESLDQEWNDVVKAKMLSMSEYASYLLDNYLESAQGASEEEDNDGSESSHSSTEDENSADNISYDLLNEFMDGMDVLITETPSQDVSAGCTKETSAAEARPALVSNSVAIEVSYNSQGQSCIDLTKMTIDQSMVEAVIEIQPEVLTMNKAITSPKALRTLLSGCICCTQLSMKGVTAVAQLGLADLPFTLTHLVLSGIDELRDHIFSTLIRKSAADETFLGVQLLDLSYTGVGDNSLRLIARHMPVLATLNVTACANITNDGLALLAYSKRLPSLKEIDLSDCEGIDGECLKPFTAHKGLVRLRSINLNGCPNISVNDLKSFVSSTQNLKVPWSYSRRHLTRQFKCKE